MLLSSIIVGLSGFIIRTAATSTTTLAVTTGSGDATTTTSSSPTTTTAAVTTHSIAVGATGFVFEPHTVTNASVGDIIEFRFYPSGHWVVRSEFKQPCIPYEDTGPNKVGFTSGAVSVATTSDNGPTFSVRVNDTEPIFFYCAASGSCVDYQMIGVINPNSTETYDIQLSYADNATYQMTPGQAFPTETASSSSTGSTSTGSTTPSSDSHHSLSAGAIAGIAIGGAAVIVLAAALLYLCGRRGGMDRAYGRRNQGNAFNDPMQSAKYVAGPAGPRSPGQETFTTTAYSVTPSNDPFQMQMQQPGQFGGHPHGMVPSGYPVNSGSPPPMSEYSQSSYNPHFGSVHGSSPLMGGVDGNSTVQTGFFTMPQPTNHQQPPQGSLYTAPIELPTSSDPGNSPLPNYSNPAHYSWAQGSEGTYRPTKPS